MTVKTLITVMKLGGPTATAPIQVFASQDAIGARMEMDKFMESVLFKVGSPTMMLTKEQLRSKIMAAVEDTISEMKNQTIAVAS